MEGVNLIKVYRKYIKKYHNNPPIQLIYVNKNIFFKEIVKEEMVA
jgi:hypothetical protein